MGSFAKARGTVRTQRRWLLVVALTFAGVVAVPAVFDVLAVVVDWRSMMQLVRPIIYAAIVLALFAVWRLTLRKRLGRIRIDSGGVFVDGERLAAARPARLVVDRREAYVRFTGRRTVDVLLDDDHEVARIVDTLSPSPTERVHRVLSGTRGANRVAMTVVIVVASLGGIALVVLPASAFSSGGIVCAVALVSIVGGVLQRARVFVQDDGVRIERTLRRERFVPFDAIERVVLDAQDLALRLRDGKEIRLHARPDALADPRLLVDRIEAASWTVRDARHDPIAMGRGAAVRGNAGDSGFRGRYARCSDVGRCSPVCSRSLASR